jgi:hypothetical protein
LALRHGGLSLWGAMSAISTDILIEGLNYILRGNANVKKVVKHLKEVLVVLPYLLLLVLIVLFLGVYRDMQVLNAQNEKLEVQLQKTDEKLDYYIYRDSTSIGHTEGPEGYERYKQRLGR